jgi:hypothetical protein
MRITQLTKDIYGLQQHQGHSNYDKNSVHLSLGKRRNNEGSWWTSKEEFTGQTRKHLAVLRQLCKLG